MTGFCSAACREGRCPTDENHGPVGPVQARCVDLLWCDDHDERADWGGHEKCNVETVMGCSTCADSPAMCAACEAAHYGNLEDSAR